MTQIAAGTDNNNLIEAQNSAGKQVFSSESTVSVPDNEFITNSEMIRDGYDLILKTDGGEIVIEGYFLASPPPMIVSEQGFQLSPVLVNSFVHSPAQYAQNSSMTDVSPVGSVQEVSGNTTVTRTDGTVETIRIGTLVYEGDIVETGADGAVNIVFIDETSFAVSDNARFAIDEYIFDPTTESGSSDFSVLRGVFVFTSGLIGRDDPDDVEIQTPVGSIGIRGTMIAGNVDTGEITVIEGAIVLRAHNGEEITLADQFATARFEASSGGITSLGQITLAEASNKFSSVSKVSQSFYNVVSSAEDGGEAGQESAASGEEEGSDETTTEEGTEDGTEGGTEEGTEDAASEDPAIEGEAEGDTAAEASGDTQETSDQTTEEAGQEDASQSDAAEGTEPAEDGASPADQDVSTGDNTIETSGTEDGTDSSGSISDNSVSSLDLTSPSLSTDSSDTLASSSSEPSSSTDGDGNTGSEASSDNTSSNTTETESATPPTETTYTTPTETANNDEDGTNTDGNSTTLDLGMGEAEGVKSLSLGANTFSSLGVTEISVVSLGDTDNDGKLEYAIFGTDANDDLHTWQYEISNLTYTKLSTSYDFTEFDISYIGDVDSDGEDEYIIGAPYDDCCFTDEGAVLIYGGTTKELEIDEYTGSAFKSGDSVTSLGDINNDGFDDFAYSIPFYNKVSINLGGASTADYATKDTYIEVSVDYFGYDISTAGDFDGDGYDDILIGSPHENRVYIYSGDGYNQLSTIIGTGGATVDEGFGNTVIGGFDFNGDGLDDIIVAGDDTGYIIYGESGVTDVTSNVWSSDGTNGFEISSVSGSEIIDGGIAGDFNGDGYDDLFIIASSLDNEEYINDIYIVYGGTNLATDYSGNVSLDALDDDNVDATEYAFQIIWDGTNLDPENIEITSIGDVDGDGFDDILIASSNTDEAYIVSGRPSEGAIDGENPDIHVVGINHLTNLEVIPSSEGDALVGDDGDNVLDDNEVANISMRGGAGEDTLIVTVDHVDASTENNHRTLDGGEGYDTLKIADGGIVNFNGLSTLESIEEIDMTNSEYNKLVLSTDDILDMASEEYRTVNGYDEAYVLVVKGDSSDTVDIDLNEFTQDANYDETGYGGYVNSSGTCVVLVEDNSISVI